MSDSNTAVAEPDVEVRTKTERKAEKASAKPKRQPRYHVLLWDDSDHTFDYVIRMMHDLFGHDFGRGMQIAKQVHADGRAICLTTTREHAELKVEQIHAFGKDVMISRCKGSMSATLEPEIH